MTVLSLSSCPPSLRGNLTKWLMEIATGVYVGRVSARVRDKIWDRVVELSSGGRAVLVYSTNNEQRMDFRVHGETWEPIDFDGLKLILRPSPARLIAKQAKRATNKKLGFSNAAKHQKAKVYSKTRKKTNESAMQHEIGHEEPNTSSYESYVVVDIETTGLKPSSDEITEVGAIKVKNGHIVDVFQSLVKIANPVPSVITHITGITSELLDSQGKPLSAVLKSFVPFLGDMPIIAHNAPFEMSFLNVAFEKYGYNRLKSSVTDTLVIAKKRCRNLDSYKLQAMAMYFEISLAESELHGYELHRSLGDCYLTYLLYQKLMKLEGAEL